MQKPLVLVIEDEAAIRDMIRMALVGHQFEVNEAIDSEQAKLALTQRIPNAILLDWMLPGKSGIEILKWLKQHDDYKDVPVIMLTAKAEEENKVRGLNHGADDYITKPFSPLELIARIKSVCRRGPLINPDGIIIIDRLQIDTDRQQVRVDGQLLALTPIEYRLLHFFITHPNKTYNRDQLITQVWSGDTFIDERSVDVQIRRLRDQLKPFGYHQLIKTVRGSGYQYQKPH